MDILGIWFPCARLRAACRVALSPPARERRPYRLGVLTGGKRGPHAGTFHGLFLSSAGSVPGMKYSTYRFSGDVLGVASRPVSRSSSAYTNPSGGAGQPCVDRPW